MDIRRITDSSSIIKKYEDKVKDSGVKKEEKNTPKEIGDKITISGAAKNSSIASIAINKIKNDAQKEFSIEKFNALREKIKSGEYNVSSAKIAHAFISGTSVE